MASRTTFTCPVPAAVQMVETILSDVGISANRRLAAEVAVRFIGLGITYDPHLEQKGLWMVARLESALDSAGEKKLSAVINCLTDPGEALLTLPPSAATREAVFTTVQDVMGSGPATVIDKIPPESIFDKVKVVSESAPVAPAPATDGIPAFVPGTISIMDAASEPVRSIVSAYMKHFQPEVWQCYKTLKSTGAEDAKRVAYAYLFGELAKLSAASFK